MRTQSVASGVRARAWQAAIAAWTAYGPSAPPSASARSSARSPRPIRSRSQRRRSWSMSSTGRPSRPAPGAHPGGLELHQRHEPVHLRLARRELGQHAAEPERVLDERGAHPLLALRRRVALVEDQVDDLEDAGQPRVELLALGHGERGVGLGERLLRARDPLPDGPRVDEERPRDLLGLEAADHPQRERDARLARERGVAAGEDQREDVVADPLLPGRRHPRRHQDARGRGR